jgi:hypothetical protein
LFEGERDHFASSPLNAGEARLLRRAISPGKGPRMKKPLAQAKTSPETGQKGIEPKGWRFGVRKRVKTNA